MILGNTLTQLEKVKLKEVKYCKKKLQNNFGS